MLFFEEKLFTDVDLSQRCPLQNSSSLANLLKSYRHLNLFGFYSAPIGKHAKTLMLLQNHHFLQLLRFRLQRFLQD
uniref:Uncharacterized protein n=1 Tax=Anguilla anguilla TaxID=7936 RepID=A0A0E9SG90_ANGAN